MLSSASEIDPQVNLEQVIKASPSQVFAAWTQTEQLRRWWGKIDQYQVSIAEVDLSIGGYYRLGTRAADGKEYIVTGKYIDIVPDQKLVFSWRWQHSAADFPTSEVTVEFLPHADGCLLKLRHRGLPTKQAQQHREGWYQAFANIAALWP